MNSYMRSAKTIDRAEAHRDLPLQSAQRRAVPFAKDQNYMDSNNSGYNLES